MNKKFKLFYLKTTLSVDFKMGTSKHAQSY